MHNSLHITHILRGSSAETASYDYRSLAKRYGELTEEVPAEQASSMRASLEWCLREAEKREREIEHHKMLEDYHAQLALKYWLAAWRPWLPVPPDPPPP
jgi:hypothetical protein